MNRLGIDFGRVGVTASLALALLVLSFGKTSAVEPKIASGRREATVVTDKDLKFSIRPLGDEVRAGKTPLLVGVENRSKYPLRISLLEREWISAFRYLSGASGGGKTSSPHRELAPGTSICHSPMNLLIVPPGGALFRGSEIDLQDAIPGSSKVTVTIRLLEVPASVGCAPARYLSGEASQTIEILGSDKPTGETGAGTGSTH
jgi:hypothetical protein